MRKQLLGGLLSLLVLTGSAKLASAQTIVFSDDFSNGLTKWQPTRDDGRFWNVANQALQAYIPFMSTITELTPISFPSDIKDFEYSFSFTPLSGADKNISFGYTDLKNWYEIHFGPTGTELTKLVNGSGVWNFHSPYTLLNGKTYQMMIRFVQGEISLFIDDELIFSQLDPSFTSYAGKIGLKASTGSVFPTKVLFDDVVVTALNQSSDFSLNVPLLKQTDPAWANLEYVTAAFWAKNIQGAPSSFKDWACNLLAQVMLLKHHGITQLPDGTELTPISLNHWLLSNKGYFNSPHTGNINRLSISQLSAAVNEKLGTPKLEFTYVNQDIIPTAIQEIEKGNPVILELEGHFVLADGFTADKNDLLIKDPGYPVDKLSQHPKTLKSLRLYTPSHTDLSYLSITSTPGVTATLEVDGEAITSVEYEETLQPLGQETVVSPTTKVIELPKPNSQAYNLTLVNDGQEGQVVIEAYKQNGQSQLLYSNQSYKGQHSFTVTFEKEGDSTLTEHQEVSFASLRQLIAELSAAREIKNKGISASLQKLVTHAENASGYSQQKLLKTLKVIIYPLPRVIISATAKQQLLTLITTLIGQLS